MNAKVWLALAGSFLAFAVCIFGGAGTLSWGEGWAFLAIFYVGMVALSVGLARHDPGLLAERMKGGSRQAGQPLWDRIFVLVIQLLWFGGLVMIGIDHRFGWSFMPVWLQILGDASVIAAFWILWRTFRENSFSSPVVRIQKERGHHVVSTGPYAIVRHPLYSGGTILLVGMALSLGSWPGLVLYLLMSVGIWGRIFGEERVLRADLPGYVEYAQRVRYRLIPYVW
jgi:protein-S-isoprenylcysteine O-methyltransferase Ste14